MGADVVSLDSTERRLNSQKKQSERLHGMAWTSTYHAWYIVFITFFFAKSVNYSCFYSEMYKE